MRNNFAEKWIAMNTAENGEVAARTSPRSVLPPWEPSELTRERSGSDLKFTAIEDGRDTKRHSVSGEKCLENEKIRVSFLNSREFNDRWRKNSHGDNTQSSREFAAGDRRERQRHGVSGEKRMDNEKARVFSLAFCEFDERGAHRRKKKKKKVEDEMVSDPLAVFGSDLMLTILYRLDARSLAQSILVSRGWQALAASDSLWSKKCEELWVGKAHLPRTALQRGISKLAAYSFSVRDAKRTQIMREDLCSHAWEFRFKTPAPLYWLNLDPSWRGTGPPMRRYFHPDGSQTADPTDRVWGGHECTYSIVTSFIGDETIREHYVRIQRWPRMSVSRKQDWGWELDNHVYCYSSIPDAEKEGGTGPLFPIWNI